MTKSLIDTAYHTIRTKILTCEYLPGSLLSIYKLSEELAMSRTPISNAIAKLELEGLVISLKNRGVMVKEVSSKEILDMFEVIFTHQMYALEKVETNPLYSFNLSLLNEHLEQQLLDKENDRYFSYATHSLQFIRQIIAAGQNQIMLQIMDQHMDKIIIGSMANYLLYPEKRIFSGAHYNEALYLSIEAKEYEQTKELLKEWRAQIRERILIMGAI